MKPNYLLLVSVMAICMAPGIRESHAQVQANLTEPRLNHFQVIGTHNSYHIAPHPSLMKLIATTSEESAMSLDYTHLPLTDQLQLGIRQFELDIFADPNGGHYANPKGMASVEQAGLPPVPESFIPDAWRQPGFPIFHVTDIDFQSRTPNIQSALQEMAAWSEKNPGHFPIAILLELKSQSGTPLLSPGINWTTNLLAKLESSILEILPRHRIIQPDDLKKNGFSLNQSVRQSGWPGISECRNRFILALDNEGPERDLYLTLHPDLKQALFFVSLDENDPNAAFIKINNPLSNANRIRQATQAGFLVRTRADAGTSQARNQDHSQKLAAFDSGAQWISTDYPIPDARLSDYSVTFQSGESRYIRWNPITTEGMDISAISFPSLDLAWKPAASLGADPLLLSQKALKAHGERNLGLASTYYAELLKISPSAFPAGSQLKAIHNMAPVLMTHPDEYFALRDVCAIHHPSLPLIAYHLFWEDDIDFPEDNDPVDHEVVWVEYQPDQLTASRLYTYFHGSIVHSAPSNEAVEGHPFQVAIEWGKHGSLPIDRAQASAPYPGLVKNHGVLHAKGTRLPNHPLARNWPKRFSGSIENYCTFSKPLPIAPILERSGLVRTGLFGNAILDQELIPYNFSAKPEWPH